MPSRAEEVLALLGETADPSRLAGMARFGIRTDRALGVTVTELRRIARGLGTDHALAKDLWASGIHEARILASIVDDPSLVTPAQMERWVRGFDSWDLCDQVCLNLFERTPYALDRALAWTARQAEFEKRAGFALMAVAAVHRTDAPDATFRPFLARIGEAADDERTYVKKAVSWALRQIGKRNPRLHRDAIATARRLERSGSRAARWVARDALRELESDAVLARLGP